MALSQKKLALIHIAKAQLQLDDQYYRNLLYVSGAVKSSRELDETGFQALMRCFEVLGFSADEKPSEAAFGARAGMASSAQIELIRDLWREYAGEAADDLSLGKWLERTFKISSLRFLPAETARKTIGALKRMKGRPAAAQSRTAKAGAVRSSAGARSRGSGRTMTVDLPNAG
jgi:hypothetical protein